MGRIDIKGQLFNKWERVQTCPLCGNNEFRPYYRRRHGLRIIQLQHCQTCNLVFQNPRLIKEALDSYYRSEYRLKLKKRLNAKHCEEMFQRGRRRGAYICKFLEENGIGYKGSLVFEVGCAYGGILDQFYRYGCKVKGCDIRPIPVKYGVSRGLNLSVGSIDSLTNLGYKADFVVLSHILEHIAEPTVFLKKVREILQSNGILYIEVPGIENPKIKKERFTRLEHLIYYNLSTIRKMTEKSGFHLVTGNEIIQSAFHMA